MEKRTGFKALLNEIKASTRQAVTWRKRGHVATALVMERERDRLVTYMERAGYGELAYAAQADAGQP